MFSSSVFPMNIKLFLKGSWFNFCFKKYSKEPRRLCNVYAKKRENEKLLFTKNILKSLPELERQQSTLHLQTVLWDFSVTSLYTYGQYSPKSIPWKISLQHFLHLSHADFSNEKCAKITGLAYQISLQLLKKLTEART